MEVYTTSFTYPRRSRPAHSPTNSLDFPAANELRRAGSYSSLSQYSNHNNYPDAQGTASPADYDAVQKVVMMAMSVHGVHISVTPADQGRAFNFQISGAYQQVMLARALILKDCPVQVRTNASMRFRCPVLTASTESRQHQSRSFGHSRFALL